MKNFGAYQHAIKFVAAVVPLLERLPTGTKHLEDQLKRASTSIPLNIAEGSGKFSPRDRRRNYVIARGSAMECSAILDVLKCLEMISVEEADSLKCVLSEIAGILARVCLTASERVGSRNVDQDGGRE